VVDRRRPGCHDGAHRRDRRPRQRGSRVITGPRERQGDPQRLVHTGDAAVFTPTAMPKSTPSRLIISGGEKYLSIEVELLASHPAGLGVAVVASRTSRWARPPCAFVVLSPVRPRPSGASRLCASRLPTSKIPSGSTLSRAPQDGDGKIQKFVLEVAPSDRPQ